MTRDRSSFLDEVVVQTSFDWCDASYLYGLALDEVPPGEQARDLVLDTLGEGLARGLLEVGDLTPTGGDPALRFDPWPVPADEALTRIRTEWLALPVAAPEPDTIVWVSATASGDELVREIEARREAAGPSEG